MATYCVPVHFTVLPAGQQPPNFKLGAYLVSDGWNDLGFKTSFRLWRSDGVGQIKIGFFKVASVDTGRERVKLPPSFEKLPDRYVSLGTDDSYYATLRDALSDETRTSLLEGLRDAAYDLAIFERFAKTAVMREGCSSSPVSPMIRW